MDSLPRLPYEFEGKMVPPTVVVGTAAINIDKTENELPSFSIPVFSNSLSPLSRGNRHAIKTTDEFPTQRSVTGPENPPETKYVSLWHQPPSTNGNPPDEVMKTMLGNEIKDLQQCRDEALSSHKRQIEDIRQYYEERTATGHFAVPAMRKPCLETQPDDPENKRLREDIGQLSMKLKQTESDAAHYRLRTQTEMAELLRKVDAQREQIDNLDELNRKEQEKNSCLLDKINSQQKLIDKCLSDALESQRENSKKTARLEHEEAVCERSRKDLAYTLSELEQQRRLTDLYKEESVCLQQKVASQSVRIEELLREKTSEGKTRLVLTKASLEGKAGPCTDMLPTGRYADSIAERTVETKQRCSSLGMNGPHSAISGTTNLRTEPSYDTPETAFTGQDKRDGQAYCQGQPTASSSSTAKSLTGVRYGDVVVNATSSPNSQQLHDPKEPSLNNTEKLPVSSNSRDSSRRFACEQNPYGTPFATDEHLLVKESIHVMKMEQRLLAYHVEKEKLVAEYEKLEQTGARTIKARKRKCALEDRLKVLEKDISKMKIKLRGRPA